MCCYTADRNPHLPNAVSDLDRNVMYIKLYRSTLCQYNNNRTTDKWNSSTGVWGFCVAGLLKICGGQLRCIDTFED